MVRVEPFHTRSGFPREALEASPSAVILAEISGPIVYATDKLRQWYGYAPCEIIGGSIEKLLPDMCDLSAQGAPLRAAAANGCTSKNGSGHGRSTPRYHRVRCKDGREVLADVTVVTVVDDAAPMLLANLGKPLPREEIDEFQDERLDAISKTASGLAHESRNALQRAVASLDLLELDLTSNPRHMELTHKIRRSLTDLLENYDEVRRFAEPIYLNRSEQQLTLLAEQAFASALHGFRESHPTMASDANPPHRLVVAADATTCDRVCVDEDKLRGVFSHVFENAMQSTGPSTVIRMEVENRKEGDRSLVCVRVTDRGPGFRDEALRQALEPFFTTRQSGTGLGLSICHRILNAHGGTLSIRNAPSGGAVVEFTLPVGGEG